MCDFDNIRKAYKKAHALKTNSPKVIEFDKNKLYNLNKLKKQLINKEWEQIFRYYRFTIYEPKERIIDAMEFEGRIVQHILCDEILKPYFEPRLIKTNCACRENKGTYYAISQVKQDLVDFLKHYNDGYVLKIDIKKFFASIDREVLIEMLSDFPDEEIKELLIYLIDKAPEETGIPIGNQSSQWFALYYLDPLDRIIKEQFRIKYYTRYMDDLIIIHQDKQTLIELLNKLKQYANTELHLSFNSKTQISPLHRGFTFLGWRYYYNQNHQIIMRVAAEKRKARVRKIKEIIIKYKNTDIKEYNLRVLSTKENLKRGKTYKFQKKYNLEVLPMKKDPECVLECNMIGHITYISEVKTSQKGNKWGYLKIEGKRKGEKIKIKVYGEQMEKITENYQVGNLVRTFGRCYLETYTFKEKTVSDIVVIPKVIEKLNNEIDERTISYTIDLKY